MHKIGSFVRRGRDDRRRRRNVKRGGRVAAGGPRTANRGVGKSTPERTGSAKSRAPAIATTVSPAPGVTSARPVSRPNAGSSARRRPSRKHGRRAEPNAPSESADAGVHVAAQRVAGARGVRLVAQHERRPRMRIADDADAPRVRRVAGVAVVVAAHQRDREVAVRVAPAQERGVERGAPGPRRRAGNRPARRAPRRRSRRSAR